MVKPKSFRPWNPEQTLLLPPSPVALPAPSGQSVGSAPAAVAAETSIRPVARSAVPAAWPWAFWPVSAPFLAAAAHGPPPVEQQANGLCEEHGKQPPPPPKQGSSATNKCTARQTQPYGGAEKQQIQPEVDGWHQV